MFDLRKITAWLAPILLTAAAVNACGGDDSETPKPFESGPADAGLDGGLDGEDVVDDDNGEPSDEGGETPPEGGEGDEIQEIASVEVKPTAVQIGAGGTARFEATARAPDGSTVSGVTFAWASSDENVAVIGPDGIATALALGETQITAQAAGITSGPALLTVVPDGDLPEIGAVLVAPANAAVETNGTFQFKADVLDTNNNVLAGEGIDWTVEGPGADSGLVSTTGLYTAPVAVPPGGTIIVRATAARAAHISGTATVTITQAVSDNPIPLPVEAKPSVATAGDPDTAITVSGDKFVNGATIQFNGTALTTTFVSTAELKGVIPAALLASPGEFAITVVNPPPGGGESLNALVFRVNEPVQLNPPPVVSGLAPSAKIAGEPGFQLTVNGSGFIPESVVRFDTVALTTTFVDATTLTADVPANLIAIAGSYDIVVVNPPPGGGESSKVSLTVNPPPKPGEPTITDLQPISAERGASATPLTVLGANFAADARINFGAAPLPTTFVSATELNATIPAALLLSEGTVPVTVTNAADGLTSQPVSFSVTVKPNPVPEITSLSPGQTVATGPDFVLTVEGTGFVDGATLTFGSQAGLAAEFESPTSLKVFIPSAFITQPGTVEVKAVNPPPGGGESQPAIFTIDQPNPKPVIASLKPDNAQAGATAPVALVIAGNSFLPGATVSFAGSPLQATFYGATEARVSVPPTLLAASREANVIVNNPGPGGGDSAPAKFKVRAPFPTVTGVTPQSTRPSGTNLTLAVIGTNFIANSVINMDGVNLNNTQFVSSTKLTVDIPASSALISAPGVKPIRVFNPPPDGGLSAETVNFTVRASLPLITGLAPSAVPAGSPDLTLTITGSSFSAGATVNFGATVLTPSPADITPSSIKVIVSAADLAAAKLVNVSVKTTVAGGGTSPAVTFTITPALPTITSMQPGSVAKGQGALGLVLIGTGFQPDARVVFDGTPITPTAVSATQASLTVPGAKVAAAGAYDVVVQNTAAQTASAPVKFTVIDGPATPVGMAVTALVPMAVPAGSPQFALKVKGQNFTGSPVVKFGTLSLTPTNATPNELTVNVPASAVAAPGAIDVSVSAGPNQTAPLKFTVTGGLAVVELSPAAVVQNPAADITLTVRGTGFTGAAKVKLAGKDMATTFVGPSELTAVLPKAELANPGNLAVTVEDGAKTTPAVQLTVLVSNGKPIILSLTPASVAAGSKAVALKVTADPAGKFAPGATIDLNGEPVTTAFVSATEVTCTIPDALTQAAGQVQITVTNPVPGGGTSAPALLSVTP